MCLIIYSPKGAPITRDIFDYARGVNPDGIGVMSAYGVEKFLGRKSPKKAWRYIRALAATGTPYGVHFRWATHGDVTRANCHPFSAPNSDAHVMHNGVLACTAADATAAQSDTALFVERYMDAAPAPTHELHSDYFEQIEKAIGWGNKLLVMHANTGAFTLCNEDDGLWIDDLWYSNDYSIPEEMSPYARYLTTHRAATFNHEWMEGTISNDYSDRNVSDAVDNRLSRESLAVRNYYARLGYAPGIVDTGHTYSDAGAPYGSSEMECIK